MSIEQERGDDEDEDPDDEDEEGNEEDSWTTQQLRFSFWLLSQVFWSEKCGAKFPVIVDILAEERLLSSFSFSFYYFILW